MSCFRCLVLCAIATCGFAGEPLWSGWRGDWSGSHPQATLPTPLGADGPVLWKTPMPGRSTSTPVLVKDRVLTLADPDLAICCDAATGKELWRTRVTLETVLAANLPDALRTELEAVLAAGKRRGELHERINAKKAELKALDAKVAAGDAAATAPRDALAAEIATLDAERLKLPKLGGRKPHGAVGDSCCTPVTDGAHAFVFFNSGIGARLDLADGRIVWGRLIAAPDKGYGQSMSPALAGNVLGLHVDDSFYGVSWSDGRLLWKDDELQHQGSPIALRVGTTDLLFTSNGFARKAADGAKLASIGAPFNLNLFTTPARDGLRLWFVAENRHLVQATFAEAGGSVSLKSGNVAMPRGVYYASPLFHLGHLFLYNHAFEGEINGKKVKSKMLHVLNAAAKPPAVCDIEITAKGNAYPSPTGVGDGVLVATDAGAVMLVKPTVTKIEVGPDKAVEKKGFAISATWQTEPFRSCPVADGKRLFLRTDQHLWCYQAP